MGSTWPGRADDLRGALRRRDETTVRLRLIEASLASRRSAGDGPATAALERARTAVLRSLADAERGVGAP